MISFGGVAYPTAVMGALGLIFGALLAFASIKFFVQTDERVSKIREILPGANCGGCGYPGCDGYADGIVSGGAKTSLCAAGGPALARKIADIMGVAGEESVPLRAVLKCRGAEKFSARNAVYEGIADCRSAAVLPGSSPNACPFGCIGLGTCVKVCLFDALSIEDGLAFIDPEKCVGCGACVAACPKSVLSLMPKASKVQVLCNSHWRGPDVKKVCSVGCIGCSLCTKVCPEKAIAMENNLAAIDMAKCTHCGTCVAKCPSKCIGAVFARAEEIAGSYSAEAV
ncbi:MAG: RnfABCDGE type electron transport complex subunit B [Synergistaceae bacterium]|jgi:Na+-translocating ferredoxin:NAD+ oxidoreductase RNF subunit RnfB|nr:RnfABCDGE type electron transport complex subunit B [Synergistaceae bacterium]